MNIRVIITAILCVYLFPLQAQKPSIDSSVFGKWPQVGVATISNDGNYILYTIEHQPVESKTLILQSTQNNWKMAILGFAGFVPEITQDSRYAVFLKSNDSLAIVKLGTSSVEHIPQISSFKLPKQGTGEWLAYQTNTPEQELILHNLITGKKKSFETVKDYLFSSNGNVLLLQTESKENGGVTQSVSYIDLINNNKIVIWEGMGAGNFILNADGIQVAFTEGKGNGDERTTAIWYYESGASKAVLLANDQSEGIDENLRLDQLSHFSKDGSKLFLSLREEQKAQPSVNAVQVDVWSYTDSRLQSQQMTDGDFLETYKAVINIGEQRVIRLERENEIVDGNDDVVIATNKVGRGRTPLEGWNSAHLPSYYMVSTEDGKRTVIKEKTKLAFVLSPEGKYLICPNPLRERYHYHEPNLVNFFTYLPSTGESKYITNNVSAEGIAGWLKEDSAMLVYDRYDIWQVDPSGNISPICVTNGYGRRHNIVFRLAMDATSIDPKVPLLLAAFDEINKDNGFYSKRLGKLGDPVRLTMGPYMYYAPDAPKGSLGYQPIKARNAEVYVVKRMSATESPNYFVTSDFRTFKPISNIYPEKAYNWLKTELHNWKMPDDRMSQGILYKPENFNPNRKYPVIFHYYEKKSQDLHVYKQPGVTTSDINIPYFVSNGYLVFEPDIHYKIGETGECAVNAVVSAAQYLSGLPYVDTQKMGIQGFSFGGFETDYIVTHTNLFAAAVSGGGFCDAISFYGTINEGGSVWQDGFERGGFGIGATPWERPDLYIKNSPVLKANQVTTPLLILNNKGDGTNNFGEAVQLFTALRRLGKRAWLLQYDDGGHGVWGKSAMDYTIRISQFFNHYLRDQQPPRWMTRGIPAKRKGIDTGYELDYTIKTPGAGLPIETSH